MSPASRTFLTLDFISIEILLRLIKSDTRFPDTYQRNHNPEDVHEYKVEPEVERMKERTMWATLEDLGRHVEYIAVQLAQTQHKLR